MYSALGGFFIALVLALAFAFRVFVGEVFSIPGGSMMPTLVVGDHILVSHAAYGYSRFSMPLELPLFSGRIFGREPERGDIVVYKLPSEKPVDYVKRIVGLPGDRIQLRQGRLYINGSLIARERLGTDRRTGRNGKVWETVRFAETLPNGRRHLILEEADDKPQDNAEVYTVPASHYFGLGDNRDNSMDSRFAEIGFIPFESLVGRFEAVFWNSVDRKVRFERRP
jgi:signal peptidase I